MSLFSDTVEGTTAKPRWWLALVLVAALLTFEAMGALANRLGRDALVDPAVTLGP